MFLILWNNKLDLEIDFSIKLKNVAQNVCIFFSEGAAVVRYLRIDDVTL